MYDGTITSKLKPIVTMLTESLVKDFIPAYRHVQDGLWERTDEEGNRWVVEEQQLRNDVQGWLLGLEEGMEDEHDLQYARMVAHMISKNPGWIDLLTSRVKKRLAAGN